ncbi:MAG TPA: hypothetical protein VF989_15340 [Polyangiaceae bacterium]|jgi:hypothetical protein
MSALPETSILVTATAASSLRREGIETARRELTSLLCGARLVSPAEGRHLALYRHRSRTSQLDVTVRVVRDGALFVVVAATVRDYR